MKVDILIAEIGSTTTIVSGFSGINTESPKFLGQGRAGTTAYSGDVNTGLLNAIDNLKNALGEDKITWDSFFASCSAAGGLRMTVHGLVYDMTVRAAKEAALGAGAVIKHVTAGKLKPGDLKKIAEINPNLILIAGGVDYGERETTLYNSERIAGLNLKAPVIYAGNIENREEIIDIFKRRGQRLYIVDNVYPRIDSLEVGPARRIIQQAFEDHITDAPGMKKVRELVDGPIIPTPGAVMEAAIMLYGEIGDLLVLDVGGATTDVHSVTEGSEEIKQMLISPEPLAKRTVEGDLGVYVNISHIVERIGAEVLKKELGNEIMEFLEKPKAIPETNTEKKLIEMLALEAVETAMSRHAGKLRYLYGPSGKKTFAQGKDLTGVKFIIGTGGVFTSLPGRSEIINKLLLSRKDTDLYPPAESKILIDNYYIMASLGVMSKRYEKAAAYLMKKSLGLI